MHKEQEFIHPVYGRRTLRMSVRMAAEYGYSPYVEPVVIMNEPEIIQPQQPESPEPEPSTPIPVATKKRTYTRKPTESKPKRTTKK